MSHLDELDEFEAKLELELKREYTAVFGLFRYCILTQDATYLCNRLDLKVAPQASYPFFHLQMEDVWVWDKNRPTRMIPRAEVYTSGDLTVEELRGEGDEPKLTAEALADRIGEPLPDDGESCRAQARGADGRGETVSPRALQSTACCSLSTSATPRPSSASTTDERLTEDWRVATERTRTGDELGVLLGGMLDLDAVDGICLASTVPTLIREWERLAIRWAARADPRRRPRGQDRHPDSLRRPTRGRPRPDRQLGRRQGALRRPGDRRRLRHLDELRRRLARG